MRNTTVCQAFLAFALCCAACANCPASKAADDAPRKKPGKLNVAEVIELIDGKIELESFALNYGPGTTFVEISLWDHRNRHQADSKDEKTLLAAMRDPARSIERRLCVASFLLDLKNEEARTFVAKCLDGEQGKTAQQNAPFILFSQDDAAEKVWRRSEILRQLERGSPERFHDGGGWRALCFWAAEFKLSAAVEPLIKAVEKNPNDFDAAAGLSHLGDKGAIPILLQTVEQGKDIREGQMYALWELGAPALPDILLRHLDNEKCIEVLGYLDAKQAIEPLKKLLADPNAPHKEEARLTLARISAADKKELAERLLEIANSKPDGQRYAVIHHIGPTGQRWAVPALMQIAKTSRRDLDIWEAIEVIGELGGDEAIAGLLTLFDHDFSKVPPSKTDFEANPCIIMALRKATGKDFGKDPQAWKQALK